MNVESLLIYGLVAVGGWLLRHAGVGLKMPDLSPTAPPASTNRLPVMTTLKADIDLIVKAAVEAAVKQAIDDIKNAAVPRQS